MALLVGGPDQHEAPRVGKRQRPEQDGVDDAEDGRVRADPETQREHGDEGEGRRPPQHARAVPHVLRDVLQHGDPAALAVLLAHAADAAEPNQRVTARIGRRHPGTDVVVDVHLQMARQLVPQVAIAPRRREESPEPEQPRAYAFHDSFP